MEDVNVFHMVITCMEDFTIQRKSGFLVTIPTPFCSQKLQTISKTGRGVEG